MQEPGVVELSDGRLYAYARTDVGCHYELYSEDRGETWTAPRPSVFRAPCSPLCIKRLPVTGDLLAVWNDHSGRLEPIRPQDNNFESKSWGRTPLVSAISRDDGRTWEHHKVLEDAADHGFCYTAIHSTDDAVLLAYCCGGGKNSAVLQDLCVRRVTVDWFYLDCALRHSAPLSPLDVPSIKADISSSEIATLVRRERGRTNGT